MVPVICLKLALKEQLLAFGILEPVYSHKLDQHLAIESWQSKRAFKSAQDSKKWLMELHRYHFFSNFYL